MPYDQDINNNRRQYCNYTYYNSNMATMVKVIADGMIKDNRPRKLHPTDCKNKSLATIEKMISRGALFLIDNWDTPEKTYLKWRQSVSVEKLSTIDVVLISFKYPNLGIAAAATNDEGIEMLKLEHKKMQSDKARKESEDTINWNEELDKFICYGDSGTRLEIRNIFLSPEEQRFVRQGVVTLSNITIVEISEDNIILEKT